MNLSVVVCTHNPNTDILGKVIESIKQQTLSLSEWELLIIDNLSSSKVESLVDISWHPNAQVIVEPELGLSFARLRGVKEAKTDLIVFVDDDNVLEVNYLENALTFFQQHPDVGCFGGKSLPVFETTPPPWFIDAGINLGCQEYGDSVYISDYKSDHFKISDYPEKAPIGTGMVIQKKAFMLYLNEVQNDKRRMALGRKGKALTSGEDNDIILTLVKNKFEIAYVPGLIVKHLIPKNRYSLPYLQRMAFESNRSWVKVLHLHGISKWPPLSPVLVPLKYIKAWITIKPWQSPLASIRYNSSCGIFKGLSELEH